MNKVRPPRSLVAWPAAHLDKPQPPQWLRLASLLQFQLQPSQLLALQPRPTPRMTRPGKPPIPRADREPVMRARMTDRRQARTVGVSPFRGDNSTMNIKIQIGLCLLLLSAGIAHAQDQPQLDLQRTRLGAGMHMIDAQLAITPEQRQTGLMHRVEMPQHEGMLFLFEQPAEQCFWMKNTLLPLTAAFVADDGTIVNLVDMKPQTTDSHCSARPVRLVLEMNQGWFAKRAIKAGFRLTGKPFDGGR